MFKMISRFIFFGALLLVTSHVVGQHFINLDFEFKDDESSLPKNWVVTEETHCVLKLDNSMAYSNEKSFLITSRKKDLNCSAVIINVLPNDLFIHKRRIEITAQVRYANKAGKVAIISRQLSSLGVDIVKPSIFEVKPTSAHKNWATLRFEQDIDPTTEHMAFGISASTSDSLWIDKFEITIDNVKVNDLVPKISEPTKSEVAWLNQSISPIDSVDPETTLNRLDFLKEDLGDVRIVALGEVTHGSSEIYNLKHLLIRFLFEKMNYTTLAMEMDMAEAETLNTYIVWNEGDPRELLLDIGPWPWKTEEFLQLLKWMNQFNKTREDKIQITGFDLPYSFVTIDQIRNFIYQHDKSILLRHADSLKVSLRDFYYYSGNGEDAEYGDLVDQIENFLKLYRMRKEELCASSSFTEYSRIEHQIITLKQGPLHKMKSIGSFSYRDKCMAENIKWLLKNNSMSKMIIWAHNGHVSKGDYGLGMGEYLNEIHPFFSIGFALGYGFFNGNTGDSISPQLLNPPIEESYEYYFSKTLSPVWLLNLKNITIKEQNKWIFNKRKFRYIGSSLLSRHQFTSTVLTKNFDAIIYIKDSSPSKLLFQK